MSYGHCGIITEVAMAMMTTDRTSVGASLGSPSMRVAGPRISSAVMTEKEQVVVGSILDCVVVGDTET